MRSVQREGSSVQIVENRITSQDPRNATANQSDRRDHHEEEATEVDHHEEDDNLEEVVEAEETTTGRTKTAAPFSSTRTRKGIGKSWK